MLTNNTYLSVSYFVGYIWQAYDTKLEKNVALKIEKKDKSKNILRFEYQVLQHLKGKQSIKSIL